MTALLVIVAILLLVLAYLLWMPVVFKINTETKEYYLQFKGLAKASVMSDPEEVLKIKLNVLFMRFNFFPLRMRRKKKKKKKEAQTKTRKTFSSKKVQAIWRMIRSFKIKEFKLDIDTGDYVLNAKLYPAFYLLRHFGNNVAVNFEDRNRLALVIQNRPINILKSFINI